MPLSHLSQGDVSSKCLDSLCGGEVFAAGLYFSVQIVFHCSRHFVCLFQWGAEDLWYTINQISLPSLSCSQFLCNPPIFSHPCRPEEGVFYGKPGPPGFDRGSKLIAGLVELSQHTEQREGERDFSFWGGGVWRCLCCCSTAAGKQRGNPGSCNLYWKMSLRPLSRASERSCFQRTTLPHEREITSCSSRREGTAARGLTMNR